MYARLARKYKQKTNIIHLPAHKNNQTAKTSNNVQNWYLLVSKDIFGQTIIGGLLNNNIQAQTISIGKKYKQLNTESQWTKIM